MRHRSASATAGAAIAGAAAVLLMTGAGAAGSPGARQAPQDRPQGRDLVFETGDQRQLEFPTVPRGYALVIGVGEYPNLDEEKQLEFARSDAEAMYRVLISQEGGAFPPENVRLLTGADATLARIREALEDWLPAVATPADRVVVYFAGHGFVHEGRGYLAPADVDASRLEETAYPMRRLGNVMANRIEARWKVLLTDACHSGKVTAETTNEALDLEFGSLPHSFLTLTASREREQSYEDPGLANGSGLFTYFLTQAWQGHADNNPCDGRITADEVIEYVRTNVRRYARQQALSQTPSARGDYDPAMLLGVGTDCLGTGDAGAPSLVGTAVVEANMDDVDLYIDGDLIETLSRDKPLTIPGLPAGLHEFTGVREGYAPETKEIMIPPGQRITVTLRIRYPRRIRESARELGLQGERLLSSRRSTLNPLNLLPVSRSQTTEDLERARELFDEALREDPEYGGAAYQLGQVHHLLGDYERSERAYRRALEIDPSDVEARTQLGAVLLESGDPDAAIRELTDAARLETTDELQAMIARAYWDKGAWPEAVTWATAAIEHNESNALAHLWKADALRHTAAENEAEGQRAGLYQTAGEDYRRFLQLTNFESSLGERLAFHLVGFGAGGRRHADREAAWRSLRTSGYLGLCITEQSSGNLLRAREYCGRAVSYSDENPMAHFLLGNVNRDLFNADQTCEHLSAAARSYTRMLELSEHLVEAGNARYYREQIGAMARLLSC